MISMSRSVYIYANHIRPFVDWIARFGTSYGYFFSIKRLSYSEAKQACFDYGSQLSSLTTGGEKDLILANVDQRY